MIGMSRLTEAAALALLGNELTERHFCLLQPFLQRVCKEDV